MTHSVGPFRIAIGALTLLLVCATSAPAQQLKLSDTIRLVNGTCLLQSTTDDKEQPPEVVGWQKCTFSVSPSGFIQVAVPGNKDEFIICVCKIAPNGNITGTGREGQGPGAYSATINGATKAGTTVATLMKVGAILRVWEAPKAP